MKIILILVLFMSSFVYADHFDDLIIQFEKEYSQKNPDTYPSIDKYFDLVYSQKEIEFHKRLIKVKKNERMIQELKRQMELEKRQRVQGNG